MNEIVGIELWMESAPCRLCCAFLRRDGTRRVYGNVAARSFARAHHVARQRLQIDVSQHGRVRYWR